MVVILLVSISISRLTVGGEEYYRTQYKVEHFTYVNFKVKLKVKVNKKD